MNKKIDAVDRESVARRYVNSKKSNLHQIN